MKILYFDTETTGRDCKKNDIVQFAGMIEIDGEVKETFNFNLLPFDLQAIEQEALAVNGLTIEKIKTFPKPKSVYDQIIILFEKYIDKYDPKDKFFPAGYNIDFDLNFMQQFFKKCGDDYGFGTWQNWKRIDPLPVLKFMDTQDILFLDNYRLETVCAYFDIPLVAHDALSDIKATREVIKKVKAFFKPNL